MFTRIYAYELKAKTKSPTTYLFAAAFFCIALISMLGTGGYFDAPAPANEQEAFLNSPYAIYFIFQYFNKFFLFLLPALIGQTIYRDFTSRVYPILYTFPIRKRDYLAGKFLSGFTYVLLITSLVGLALISGEWMLGLENPKIGPFRPGAYLSVFATIVIPNILAYGLLIFAVVGTWRNIYAGFITVIILFFLQLILENLFTGQPFLLALTDPFGQNTIAYLTQHWSIADQNTLPIPLWGVLLGNRLLWLGLTSLACWVFYRRFELEQETTSLFRWFRKGGKIEPAAKHKAAQVSTIHEVIIHYPHSRRQQFRTLFKLTAVHFQYIIKGRMFWMLLVFGILAVIFALGRVTDREDLLLLPLTRIMLSVPMFFFSTIIMLITFLYAGMLVHRARQARMDQLIDVSPVTNWVLMGSKFIALIQVQIMLLLVMMACGIVLQLYHGYFHFEVGLYLFHLLVITLPPLIIWAAIALACHSLISNLYAGLFLLLLLWMGRDQLPSIGIETYLARFNSAPQLLYSDMNGFGQGLGAHYLIHAYWLAFSGLILVGTYLLWQRGPFGGLKERLLLARKRISPGPLFMAIFFSAIFLLLGFVIFQTENQSQATDPDLEVFKEQYDIYQHLAQPSITTIELHIELFPEQQSFTVTGHYLLINKSGQPVDLLLIRTGYDEITHYTIPVEQKVVSRDTQLQFTVHQLQQALAPGDSLHFQFNIRNPSNTLFERRSGVLQNGTFLRTDILPRFGYFLDRTTLLPEDSLAKTKNFYADDADLLDLKVVIGTSREQTALAPGDLVKSWVAGDRQYFQYQTSGKIKFATSFNSGKYTVRKENYRGVDLGIYFHPTHQENIAEMIAGLKAALDYNTQFFGPYQHGEAKIIEFPLSEGTYATTMANCIPVSEQRFVVNNQTEQNKVDLAFYVAAHELTHQWWGNQLVPANAQGATMLTESITEYISLNLYEQEYGTSRAEQFLKLQRLRYLRGRSQASEKEVPLFRVNPEQSHIAYGKGAMAFHALKHYLGESALNRILSRFLAEYKFRTDSYPTSIDLLQMLRSETPPALQYLITDYFETITFYDNQLLEAKLTKPLRDSFSLNLVFQTEKYRQDTTRQNLVLDDLLEIGFYDDNDTLIAIKSVRVHQRRNELSFLVGKKPSKIILDPNLLLLDQKMEDNTLNVRQ